VGTSEDTYYNHNLNLNGYLGITDQLTLRTNLILSPDQTVHKISKGGKGEDKNKFYFSPQITLSFRPSSGIEIFGDIAYLDMERMFGPTQEYRSVPVGYDSTGSVIYDRLLVTSPALPKIDYKSAKFKIGITYFGKLW